MTTKTSKAALQAAIKRAQLAQGEAMWTNGYRAGRLQAGVTDEAEQARLYAKELAQHKIRERAEATVERHLAGFARVVRASARGTR